MKVHHVLTGIVKTDLSYLKLDGDFFAVLAMPSLSFTVRMDIIGHFFVLITARRLMLERILFILRDWWVRSWYAEKWHRVSGGM